MLYSRSLLVICFIYSCGVPFFPLPIYCKPKQTLKGFVLISSSLSQQFTTYLTLEIAVRTVAKKLTAHNLDMVCFLGSAQFMIFNHPFKIKFSSSGSCEYLS